MFDTKFWKKYFTTYDVLNLVIPYQELLDELIKNLDVKSDELILDAGSGTGNLTIKLERIEAKVIALDYSKEGLESHKAKDENANTIQHDLSRPLPFTDSYFDKIVSNNTIYTISPEKRPAIFKEFYRVLKPGGKIVIANVHTGFKPFEIYKEGIKKMIHKQGVLYTIFTVLKMIVPTIKIFYFNSKIKKEHKVGDYHFMKENEQQDLLRQAGFKNISENKLVYANQGILNSAEK